MTFPQARSHGKTLPSEANSVAAEKRAANASRSRASARRREAIMDAALAVAATGGYDAPAVRPAAYPSATPGGAYDQPRLGAAS